jgi:hypothetical protein
MCQIIILSSWTKIDHLGQMANDFESSGTSSQVEQKLTTLVKWPMTFSQVDI